MDQKCCPRVHSSSTLDSRMAAKRMDENGRQVFTASPPPWSYGVCDRQHVCGLRWPCLNSRRWCVSSHMRWFPIICVGSLSPAKSEHFSPFLRRRRLDGQRRHLVPRLGVFHLAPNAYESAVPPGARTSFNGGATAYLKLLHLGRRG